MRIGSAGRSRRAIRVALCSNWAGDVTRKVAADLEFEARKGPSRSDVDPVHADVHETALHGRMLMPAHTDPPLRVRLPVRDEGRIPIQRARWLLRPLRWLVSAKESNRLEALGGVRERRLQTFQVNFGYSA